MSAIADGTVRTRPLRSPTLGIVAAVIATQCVTTLMGFPELVLIYVLHVSEAALFAALFFLTTGGGLVAVGLGLGAAIGGRGRWWGVAAVLIAILGNVSVLELTRTLVGARG